MAICNFNFDNDEEGVNKMQENEDLVVEQSEDEDLKNYFLSSKDVLEGFEIIRNYPYCDDNSVDLDIVF